jgi:hypothetical protein
MLRRVSAALTAACALLVVVATCASATTFTPTRFDDPNTVGNCPTDCSLRQAEAAAGANDTIQLLPGTYVLTQATGISIGQSLTIQGAGRSLTTISGSNGTRVLQANGGVAQLNDLTIEDGYSVNLPGAGLFVSIGATAVATRVDFVSSQVQVNGTSEGGAISVSGLLRLRQSTVSDNSVFAVAPSAARGGAIMVYPGAAAQIANSTFIDNSATSTPGAGSGGGGALYVSAGASASIINSTFGDGNAVVGTGVAGGQILAAAGAAITLSNSIIANGGTPVSVCSGASAITSLGGNIAQPPINQCNLLPSDRIGVDPVISPPALNGGGATTQMIGASSPAVNFGTASGCGDASVQGVDERGGLRTVGSGCDSGAVERNSLASVTVTGSISPARYPETPVSFVITNNGPDDVLGVTITNTSCAIGFLASGASTTCNSATPWNGTSPITQTFQVGGPFNTPSGTASSVTLSTLAPRLTQVSLRPPKLTATKRGASLGTKKVKGAATIAYKGIDLVGLRAPIQRPIKGNVKSGKCVKRKAGTKPKGRTCAIWKTLTTATVKNAKASGKLYLTGRVKGKALTKGTYRIGLTAVSSDGGIGSPWYIRFSVK